MVERRSEVGNLGVHLGRIGAELDRFLEFREGGGAAAGLDGIPAASPA